VAGLVSFYLKAENTEGGKLDGEWTENGQRVNGRREATEKVSNRFSYQMVNSHVVTFTSNQFESRSFVILLGFV
jgi:hypothetical protein